MTTKRLLKPLRASCRPFPAVLRGSSKKKKNPQSSQPLAWKRAWRGIELPKEGEGEATSRPDPQGGQRDPPRAWGRGAEAVPSPWAGRQRRCQQSPEPLLGFSPVFLVNRGQKCWGSSPNPFFERVPGGANLVLLLPSCDGKGPAHVPKMRPFAGRAAVPCSPTALALPPLPPPLPPAPRSRLLASLLLLSPSPPAILCLRNSFTDPRRGARLWAADVCCES